MTDAAHPFGRKARVSAVIDPARCTGCGYCAGLCLMSCILPQGDGLYRVDAERCIGCRSCVANCPFEAVTMLPPGQEA